MGQAKLRGTFEERKAAAIALAEERRKQREYIEMERERKIAEEWAKLPKEEQERRLERAKAEAIMLAELSKAFKFI